MNQARVLLLDCAPSIGLGEALRSALRPHVCSGGQIQSERFLTLESVLESGQFPAVNLSFSPDVVFLVLSPGLLEHGLSIFQAVRKLTPEPAIIAAMESGEPAELFTLLELGAADFILPPFKAYDVLPRVWRLLRQSVAKGALVETLKRKQGLKQLVGESQVFLAEVRKIPLIAGCEASVLISGETGTGKELCARAIHYLSARAGGPFVPVNCGAIPSELVENELFGHEQGAFTGAATSKPGLIREADSGTLFLDEIDCLPLLAQVKLLRFLQEKEYRPLGATKTRRADVRIIAASNTDLDAAVRCDRFRQDLYYRLNIIPITLPPLRLRRDDIPLLAQHFLEKYTTQSSRRARDFSPEALALLERYDWPGNIRELEHVVQRAVALSGQQTIRSCDILVPCPKPLARQESFQKAKRSMIDQFERTYIQRLLLAHNGNITKAAQAAQKNRRAFWQLIRKHQIDVQEFKIAS